MRDDSFQGFVRSATPSLTRSAYLLTGDHHLAEDLLQSAFARAHKHWRRIRDGNPEAYVRKVLYHEQVSFWRRRRIAESPWQDTDLLGRSLPDFAEDAAVRLSVREALAALSPRQRAVLILRYFEDLSEAETAAMLGCTLGTVKRHSHDALARLREVVEPPRGRRPVRTIAAVFAAITTGLVLLSGLPWQGLHQIMAPGRGHGPSIPDRIGKPPLLWPRAKGSAMGPASVVFGGFGWSLPLLDEQQGGDLAVVGAESEVYRSIYLGYPAHALLSADGSLLAFDGSLLYLRTGEVKSLPHKDAEAVAWSPEGARLALVSSSGALIVLDLANGGEVEVSLPGAGVRVAFASGSGLLAYQFGHEVFVTGPGLETRHRFLLPDGERLAGKGAWTADGTALATTKLAGGVARISLWDATDGHAVPGPVWTLHEDEEIVDLPLLGWNPDGDPVVAVVVRSGPVKVVALTASGPRTLLTSPEGITSIDVSTDAVSGGLVRPGRPPVFGPVHGGALTLAVLLAWLVWVLYRRRRRRRAANA